MKNKKSLLAQMLVVMMILALLSPVTSFAATDETPPTLNELTVSPREASVGDTVKIVADLTDDLSGVKRIVVQYQAPVGTASKDVTLDLNPESGKYEGSFTLEEHDAWGNWGVYHIMYWDNQDNRYTYYNSNGGSERKYDDFEYKDLSEYDVLFSSVQEDNTPPTLNNLQISSQHVSVGDTVKIVADLTDDLSGVKRIVVRYQAPVSTASKDITLTLNPETGKYEGSFTVGQFDASGNWGIYHIMYWDNQDNRYTYYNSNGGSERKYDNFEYKDLSEYDVIVSNEQEDKTPPTLNNLEVSPQHVSVGDTVKVVADLTDDLTGVKRISVRYQAPVSTASKDLTLSLDPKTGKYEGSFTIGQYDALGNWGIYHIMYWDNQDNRYTYYNSNGGSERKYDDFEYKDLSEYDVVVEEFDQQAPVTNMEIEASSPKNGEWYSSDVTVSLNADDDQGVDKTFYKINDGDWVQYTEAFDIQEEGLTTISYKSVDKAGNEEAEQSEVIQFDQTAPVTTTSDVPENWANENVAVTLEGTDEISGIAFTEYRMNNGEWTEYTAPIQVTEDGNNVIEYRSVDVAGNVEEAQHAEVKIDKTKPALQFSFDQSVITKKNHKLVPIKSTIGTDDSLSGVASIELVSIVSNQADNGSGDGKTEQDIQGFEIGTADTEFLVRAETTANEDRIYTVTYKAIDNAGNEVLATEDIRVKGNQAK
ncbi:MAG: OmpL47-type beta-barrel domain-containing protein [Bacillota bacterium]